MNDKINLFAEDCTRIGDSLYFFAWNYNLLFRVEIKTGEITLIDSMPEVRPYAHRLCGKILNSGNDLYMCPMNAEKVWKYDLSNAKWTYYDRENLDGWEGPNHIFEALKYKECIFLMGSYYPAIMVINTKTNTLEYIKDPYVKFYEKSKELDDCFFRTGYVQENNYLYRACCLSNEVLKLNLDTYEYEYISVGDENRKYSSIDWDGNYFYIAPRKKGPVVKWDGEKGVEEIDLPFNDQKEEFTIGNVLCKEDKIYVSSSFMQESFVIASEIGGYRIEKDATRYWFKKKVDDSTYVSLTYDGKLSVETDEGIFGYELIMDQHQFNRYLGMKCKEREDWERQFFKKSGDLYNERKSSDLEMFINSL